MRIWTDGSCLGNPGPGAWAFIAMAGIPGAGIPPVTEVLRRWGVKRATTNNEMELAAVLESLEWISRLSRDMREADQEIITDSALVVGWLSLGYRANAAHLRPMIERCRDLISSIEGNITFTHTRGHAYDEMNNSVDRLVRSQAEKLRNSMDMRHP